MNHNNESFDWIARERTSINQRENFFYNRGANVWNQLPCSVKSAGSKNGFKHRYDDHIKRTHLTRRYTTEQARQLLNC